MYSENSLSTVLNFTQFHEHIFLKVIKQPFHRCVNHNRFWKIHVILRPKIFFFSILLIGAMFDV